MVRRLFSSNFADNLTSNPGGTMLKLKAQMLVSITSGLAYFATSLLTGAAIAEESLTANQYFARACQESNDAQYGAAVADYDKAIAKKPEYWEAYGNRAAARFNLHDYDGALRDVDTSIAHLPPNSALNDLKHRSEHAIAANSSAARDNAEAVRRRANQMLLDAQLGGDLTDSSTLLMMQAQRRGLIPATQPIVPIRAPQPVTQPSESSEGDSPFAKSSKQRPDSNAVQSGDGTGPFK
jgi:tetratricopeptide (TPR) repeat protein